MPLEAVLGPIGVDIVIGDVDLGIDCVAASGLLCGGRAELVLTYDGLVFGLGM